MPIVLTFVAAQHYSDFKKKILDILSTNNLMILGCNTLHEERSYDVVIPSKIEKETLNAVRAALACDVFMQPCEVLSGEGDDLVLACRKKQLLLADMDATMVQEETLDELAAFAGLKDEIAEITARSMRGEIDFETSVTQRVGMLKGLKTSALNETLSHMNYMPGGDVLVRSMKAFGAHCVLVSGGFTYFTEKVAAHLGFDENFGNRLIFEGDNLTGDIERPIQGRAFKGELLKQKMYEKTLLPEACMAVGDGANDLDMLSAAGLGVGYHPKPVLHEALDNVVIYGDLSTLLYAQGYRFNEIIF